MRLTTVANGIGLALLALIGTTRLTPAGAVDYTNVVVQPDRTVPAACFSFTAALPRGKADAFEPFVSVSPRVDGSLQARGKDLCLTGLKHGARYTVRLKAGLPAGDGSTLAQDVSVDVLVPDREPQLRFSGGRTLLPYTEGVGLPLQSVNVRKAHVAVYRFGERALAEAMGADWFGQGLSGYSVKEIADRSTRVFDGAVDLDNKPNADLSTALPLGPLLKGAGTPGGLSPGVYAAVAWPATSQPDDDADRATQWFSVSDIGLVTIKTDAGLLVGARSLQTALPLPGVTVRLLSRANEVLASQPTDGDGRTLLSAGLLRGQGGNIARLVTATSDRGDFTMLPMDAPALDLSDLDLKGRTPPGPLDAFLWTDRGIYRPGETIHLGTLVRDKAARLPPRTPVTLHLLRPDGIEASHMSADLDRAGGGTLDIPVPDNAYSGTWTVWAGAGGPDRLGEVTVVVQDFVPPRLEARLDLPDGPVDGHAALTPSVVADYFFGSPGADLGGDVTATVQAAAHPFTGFEGYAFGLVQEPVLPKRFEAQSFTTDDKGRATVTINPEELPDTAAPLEVSFTATVNDVDGRAATAELTRPLRTADRFIGLRLNGPPGLQSGAEAGFDVVLLDGDGRPAAPAPLQWDLVRETYTYTSFFRDGRWQFEEVVEDARVNGGTLTPGPDGRGHVSAPVTTGRFRFEVYAADGTVASSLRFGAGWWGEAASSDKPEVLPVSVGPVRPDGTVEARIEPAFPGRVMAMLAGDGLHQIQELDLPRGGGTVVFKAADVPAAGAYVFAVAVAPAGAVLPRLPVRAVGAAWVPGEAAAHKLAVTLNAPDTTVPKTSLPVTVTVTVAGAPRDQPAYVTVAAVDEAVLRMTAFDTPDPAEHFVGRREPGLEWRDVYGSLIDPTGQPGRLVEGGDAQATRQMGNLDVKTFKTVALFSGPVMLDADGHGTVSLPVPEFSGRLRLMAVAWTADRFGAAEASVTVRPPLLAELTLPRFLAPGDKASVRAMLTDLAAPEQGYKVTLSTDGPVAFDKADIDFRDVKRDKRRYAERALTATGGLGPAHIHMAVEGQDGTRAERDFDITVRAPNAYVTTRQIRALDPGASLTAGDALGQDMLPGTASLDVTVATGPAFDVPGLLADLRRYPYGCAEQTVSRAFPELYATALGGTAAPATAGTVTGQGAIARLISLQAADGSFGYWTPFDTGNLWLTAYVTDFLQHAAKQGYAVPGGMTGRALTWLSGRFAAAGHDPADVAGNAYAAVVLARAGQLDLSQLRYVSTRDTLSLPSEAARVQLAAALGRAGERDLQARLLALGPVPRNPATWLNDYGSDLRDRALALSVAAEEKLLPERTLLERAADLSRAAAQAPLLSTQEQAWLVRGAFDLTAKGTLDVVLDGKPVQNRSRATATVPLGLGRSLGVTNKGAAAVSVSLATTGVPAGVQPPEANGFTVKRGLFRRDGRAVDLADVHQNDEVVVVLEGDMDAPVQRKALVVDLLPAGLEPDQVGTVGSTALSSLDWLKGLSEASFTALRDDRYVAGLDLEGSNRAFKLAYLVRAVTPGTYGHPGVQVEDMYAPAYHARGPAGSLEVKGPRRP